MLPTTFEAVPTSKAPAATVLGNVAVVHVGADPVFAVKICPVVPAAVAPIELVPLP